MKLTLQSACLTKTAQKLSTTTSNHQHSPFLVTVIYTYGHLLQKFVAPPTLFEQISADQQNVMAGAVQHGLQRKRHTIFIASRGTSERYISLIDGWLRATTEPVLRLALRSTPCRGKYSNLCVYVPLVLGQRWEQQRRCPIKLCRNLTLVIGPTELCSAHDHRY